MWNLEKHWDGEKNDGSRKADCLVVLDKLLVSCSAEVRPVFTYNVSAVMDLKLRYCFTDYTIFATNKPRLFGSNMDSNFCLWSFSSGMIDIKSEVLLKINFGCKRELQKLNRMMGLITKNQFKWISKHWSSHSIPRDKLNIFRVGTCTDSCYYSPLMSARFW